MRLTENGWEMPELWRDYIDWLCDPERDGTKRAWAEAHDVAATRLSSWMRNPSFRYELEKRLADMNVHPDRVQQVVDAMFEKAKKGDVQAAKLYLDFIRFIKPPLQIVEDAKASEMSDSQLAAALDAARARMPA